MLHAGVHLVPEVGLHPQTIRTFQDGLAVILASLDTRQHIP